MSNWRCACGAEVSAYGMSCGACLERQATHQGPKEPVQREWRRLGSSAPNSRETPPKVTQPIRVDVMKAPVSPIPKQGPPPIPRQDFQIAYAPRPKMNTHAILSVVFALFVCGGIGSILAIFQGRMAKEEIAATGERGLALASAGMILGWIGVVGVALGLISGAFS